MFYFLLQIFILSNASSERLDNGSGWVARWVDSTLNESLFVIGKGPGLNIQVRLSTILHILYCLQRHKTDILDPKLVWGLNRVCVYMYINGNYLLSENRDFF